MTEEMLKVICQILHDKFGLDDLDLIVFVMEYEKRTGEKIPEQWLAFTVGTMKTIKLK